MLSDQELGMMREIEQRLMQIHAHLSSREFPSLDDVASWYVYLAELKAIQGNSSNDVSFVATLMAKQYLAKRYGLQDFDAADKPQGAPGIDIDARLPDGRRLVAEIKTASLYKPDDLGSQQKTMFEKDFVKLIRADADIKLFFLTERATFGIMKRPKYRAQLSGVVIVLLPTSEEIIT